MGTRQSRGCSITITGPGGAANPRRKDKEMTRYRENLMNQMNSIMDDVTVELERIIHMAEQEEADYSREDLINDLTRLCNSLC